MIRQTMFKLMTVVLALGALAVPALSQQTTLAGKKENGKPVRQASIEVLSVRKMDAQAKTSADGKQRSVPVVVTLKSGNWGADAVLKRVSLDLVTFNTDGSQTPLKKEFSSPARANQLITLNLDLPMPVGVFAERFDAALVAIIHERAGEQQLITKKSGKIER